MQVLIGVTRNIQRPNITNSNLKGELFAYTEPILSALNDKLGDNLIKVRQLSEEALLSLSEHPSFGVSACLSTLFRSQYSA